VVFGPGSIAQAHKPDEFITLEQVDACVTFMRRLMTHLATPAAQP
jgi:acetylornithine deacetylase